jgi:hypothetical protein
MFQADSDGKLSENNGDIFSELFLEDFELGKDSRKLLEESCNMKLKDDNSKNSRENAYKELTEFLNSLYSDCKPEIKSKDSNILSNSEIS